MSVVARIALPAASLVARLLPRQRRPPEEQARLARAAAGVDRELAGNVELVTMYMQTKQPAVLEIAAFTAYGDDIAAADADLGRRLGALYESVPDAEDAMERRGPAGSIKNDDRAIVERWEGGARVLQREVRLLPASRPPSAGDRLVAWIRARAERTPGV